MIDSRRRRALRVERAEADPRFMAAHDNLCEAADLLEALFNESCDERFRAAMLAIDMARLHLKPQ